MKKWAVLCIVASLLVAVGCAGPSEYEGREVVAIQATGYGPDAEAARQTARENVMAAMEERDMAGYEIVETRELEVEETSYSASDGAEGEQATVSVTGVTAKMEYTVVGPAPEPEGEPEEKADDATAEN
jgi:hypothetical protein